MPKTDYYDDPRAPRANSLVVAVAAIVRNESGDVLMIERTDNGLWAVPGGAQDIGETTREAAMREIREETGIEVEVTGIVGIYSDPRHVIAYDDGEVRQEFSIVFHAQPTGGELRTSSESRRVHWVEPEHIETLSIDSSMRLRIQHALENRARPYLS
ncbi:ADP-ribose pyrophosphatase YjhB (NUDIX family) [Halopolyspora algeriensis]|uniref:ADP-ribose pyrophosphatase YjhB (NUDIX family) n=1 Tax=Halopolyspora algeriensis TaxID=1500506 RepID=A0A368VVK1_9ACTN|nr:NUDIX domain-containing protein [Halopolyspora algeriensis]RCW44678.1 ADP-ribose pyrophosphatase YjhB (NUDIX family) [Halopolyspora algeriensis]TQM56036.1 ADP-ribose pyrophosphatase YjhB (NUDIX family) [Halopolyspora algeriensis]